MKIFNNLSQWRAVTSESGHAICMPKSGHENMKMGMLWVINE